MPSYVCVECMFKTSLKTDYKRHLITKKHQKTLKNCEDTTVQHTPGGTIGAQEGHKSRSKPICLYCNALFASKHSARRHERKYCRERKKMLELAKVNVVSNITNNTMNNTTINNITINGFRREELEFITDTHMTSLLHHPHTMIPSLIKAVHFDKDHPENHNIRYPNKNENLIVIYVNDEWNYADKYNILAELIENKYSDLDEHFDSVQNKLRPNIKQNYIKFSKLVADEDVATIKKLHHKCHIMLLNARDISQAPFE